MPTTEEHTALATTLTDGVLQRHPWSHAYLRRALPESLGADLVRDFEQFRLIRTGRETGAKPYQFAHTELRGASWGGVSPAWQFVADVITGSDYRRNLERLTGVDLGGAEVGMDLWEYRGNDWLAPHVDKEDKIVTQILYLTENWTDRDGGQLLILNSNDPADLHRALPPRMGSSAILVRSESSWHTVAKIAPGGAPRRSLTITFRQTRTNR
ncbi:2OG-Fe(II) oxygenase family protein [Nocardia asiatica]|uniref:2OG-Fe(II) oxygenase family protein n=1 Tax=Nocardia asiatica TaxID=209252 RepID=UPI000314C9DA|nr:2OG-Fe(II) oxygenase family protein [Nocardia asiatica]